MSKADEMFEKLNYIILDYEPFLEYWNKEESKDIIFYRNKTLMIDADGITMEELKVINEKCKELGWLDE